MVIVVTMRAAAKTLTLGRYQVVKHLADGGMADVLLARTTGIEGFERHVVIKRIRAEQASDTRFVHMFLDEARLAASLHHHNIVQVNDIGEEDGQYFFAMEYVHGEDANMLLREISERGERIPLEHVLTIVTAAAAGLHHAHDQRGPDRSPLGIVHRDVSPANILIGYDGGVKLVDFGIAKATHRTEHTQSGTLKGKVAYMSPEQCLGEVVDRRSDVFSLGIVLYELATLHPLFHADNDFLTMSAVVNGNIPRPSQVCPDVPAGLEAIILKALAAQADDRFTTADELRLALEQFAAGAGLRTSTTTLADYMKQCFGARPEPWLEEEEDDDDLELEVTMAPSAEPTAEPTAVEPPPVEPPPVESPVEAPVEVVAARSRDCKPTLPICKPPSNASIAPIVRASSMASVPAPPRRWWIAGAVGAVAAIGLALVVVKASGHSRAAEAPAPAPISRRELAAPPAPAPAPAPAVIPAPPHAAIAAPSPPPAPKKRAHKAAPAPAPAAPAAHWDPDSLFPR